MEMERIVEKFWKGLEDGVIYARKCKECGAIEFPPHLACNTCGYHETEWTTLTGKGELVSFVFTGVLNSRLELDDMGLKYVCGEVKLDEGCLKLMRLFLESTRKKQEKSMENCRSEFVLYSRIWADIQHYSLNLMSKNI